MRVRFLNFRPWPILLPNSESRGALLAPVLAVAAALAALSLLGLTGHVTTAGYDVRSLERIHAAQKRDIQQIEAEAAGLASLAQAAQQAKERWNMAPPEKLLHVMVDVPATATGNTRPGR